VVWWLAPTTNSAGETSGELTAVAKGRWPDPKPGGAA
jgi:hypothetical protein